MRSVDIVLSLICLVTEEQRNCGRGSCLGKEEML